MSSSEPKVHEGKASVEGVSSTSIETLKTYFEHLFANSRDVMNLFSITQGKVILLNAAAEETTGYNLTELQSLPIDALYPPEEHAKLQLAFARLQATGYSTDKLCMYGRNGELRDIWTRSYIVQREPEAVCIVHTIDITEDNRKRDRELRDAKLATLGEASATLAHELKNALQSMQFSLATLRAQFKQSGVERGLSSLDRIERAAAHMDDVISGIEKSANASKAGGSHLSVAAAVQNAAFLMHSYLQVKGVELSTKFGSSLPLVWCNRAHLEQILIVLIKNAAQAMASRPQRQLRISTVSTHGSLRVDVSDTGGGLPSEVQAHLFEAFRTTKPAGIGQGLGLATAKQLAIDNALELSFESQAGVGTTFSIRFPVLQAAGDVCEAAPLSGRLVLLVGDETASIERATAALEGAGARVLLASAAPDALQLLRVHDIGAVLCDDAMYPVRAWQFVQEARKLYRGPICLVANDRQALPAESLTGVDSVVTKPIDARTLVRTLQALLT